MPAVLLLRDAPKSILSKPKWGAQAVATGGRHGTPSPTVATTLATSTKNDTPEANFVNSRQKTTKSYSEPGCKFELNLKKVGCFAELEKTAFQQKESDEVETQA